MQNRKLILMFLLITILIIFSSCSQATQSTGSIMLVNNSNYIITGFYISPTTSETWGNSQLGSNTVSPSNSCTVKNIPAGTYDLRAYLYSYGSIYHYGVAVQAGNTTTWTISSRGILKGIDETL